MLDAIRKRAASWVVKVLLLLLVASFAIWGIGDIFYGSGQNPTVAKVGETEITAAELAQSFDRAVSNLSRRIGTPIDRDQAIQMGLMQQALQDLIRQRLIDLGASDLDLTVDDDTLRALITDNPVFQTAGEFDRSRFDQLLLTIGLSEQGYLVSLRQDVVRANLTRSLAAPVAAPAAMVDTLYRYRNQQRRGDYVLVTFASISDLPTPSDADLESYHEANAARFTTPERRRLTLVTLTPEDLLDEIEIAEDQIVAEYESRRLAYRTPERRTVRQVLGADREALEEMRRQLAEGVALAEAVDAQAEAGLALESLGEVAQGELPETFDTAIFALAEGEISQPIESPFGWHLFQVEAIVAEEVVPLAEVRKELARGLALVEAEARLPEFAAQLDDELAGGGSLAAAAAVLGLTAAALPAVDRRGRDAADLRPEALPVWPEILQVAFASVTGEPSLLEETDAGTYFVLQVDEVIAPRLRPVDEVRDQLVAAWVDEQRANLAEARAELLREQAADAASLAGLEDSDGLTATAIEPLRRSDTGADQGLDQAVVRALFATKPGTIAAAVVPLAGGVAIVATTEVIEAEPGDDPDAVARLESELEGDLQADLLAQFERQLRRSHPVEIDASELARLMTGAGFGAV